MTQKELNNLFIDIINNQHAKQFFAYKEELEKISLAATNIQDRIFKEFIYHEAITQTPEGDDKITKSMSPTDDEEKDTNPALHPSERLVSTHPDSQGSEKLKQIIETLHSEKNKELFFKTIITQTFTAELLNEAVKNVTDTGRKTYSENPQKIFSETAKRYLSYAKNTTKKLLERYFNKKKDIFGSPSDEQWEILIKEFNNVLDKFTNSSALYKLFDKDSDISEFNETNFNVAISLCNEPNKVKTYISKVVSNLADILSESDIDKALFKRLASGRIIKNRLNIDDIFNNEELNKFWSEIFYHEVISKNAAKFDSLIAHLGQPMSKRAEQNLQKQLNSDNMQKAIIPILKERDKETNMFRNELTMYSFIGLIIGFLDAYAKNSRHKKHKDIFNESVLINKIIETAYLEGIISNAMSKLYGTTENILSNFGKLTFSKISADKFIDLGKKIINNNKELIGQIADDLSLNMYEDISLDILLKDINTKNEPTIKESINFTNSNIVPKILNQLPKYAADKNNPIPKTLAGKLLRTAGNSALKGKKILEAAKTQTQASQIIGKNVTKANDDQ